MSIEQVSPADTGALSFMFEEKQEKIDAYVERKRAEFWRALDGDEIHDPITATVFGSVILAKILGAVAISAALTLGTALVTRALTKRQKLSTGAMSGNLQVPQSDMGLPIQEGYGGDPASHAGIFQASHAYALEARVISGGYFYVVTTAGTSAGAPTFPTTVGASVTSGTVTFTNYGRTGGGFRLGMLIVWTSGIRKHVTTTRGGGGGKGPKPPETQTIEYDLDLALMPGRGPLRIRRITANTDILYDTIGANVTGVIDPLIPPDDDYPHDFPPGAEVPYTRPSERFSGALSEDPEGVLTGSVVGGSNANIAIYPGNTIQLPDPTMQGAIDALYGADSTPAFRNRCLVVLKNFFLTKYGGGIPLINFVAEHQEIDTFEAFCDHMGARTGVLTAANYDFTALRRLFLRGFVVNPLYQPSEVMEALAEVFNCYFAEGDKIYGRVRGGAVVATIDDTELGWVDGDSDTDEQSALQELDAILETETEIARKITFKFVSPDKNFEQDAQSDARQITDSEKVDGYELPLTIYAEEARGITQRELYEEEVESTKHEGTVDWSYLWLMPGDSVTVTRDEGFTHRIFITDLNPCIGVIPFKGLAEETAVFTQPVATDPGVFEIPPVPIPGMSVLGIYDGPLLSDEHNTVNNGTGMYVWATRRRGDGDFGGSALFMDKGLGQEMIATFEKEAISGVTASVLTASTTVHIVVADAVTVDLYTEDTLESVSRADLMMGANACIIGDEVCQILTATREPDTVTHPNRWYLVIGLRARRGTDFAINDHASGERFVLINDAVKFVPLNLNDLDVEREFVMVTANQSLDDAAVVTFRWTGGSRKDLAPVNPRRRDDSADNSLLEFAPRRRLGYSIVHGVSGFTDADIERFELDIFSDSSRTAVVRTIPAESGKSMPALLLTSSPSKFTNLNVNTLEVNGNSEWAAISIQEITWPGNVVEATLTLDDTSLSAKCGIGLVGAYKEWQSADFFSSVTIPDYYVELRIVNVLGNEVPVLHFYQHGDSLAAFVDAPGRSVRIRITISGTEVRFTYGTPTSTTPASRISTIPPNFPIKAFAFVSGETSAITKVEKIVMTTWPDAKTIYSAAQQVEDFGSVQTTIHADIYQISRVVGRGYPAEVSLTDSL